jgi:8-oxo-dGTP diphosphatase
MDDFAISVKSFIVNKNGELLLIKRRDSDVNKPGIWEIPGGRLKLGEDPFNGLKRETFEETGLNIEIKNPLKVQHFTRDDGQKITMITFLCSSLTDSVVLSEEHEDFIWISLNQALSKIYPAFREDINIIKNYFMNLIK